MSGVATMERIKNANDIDTDLLAEFIDTLAEEINDETVLVQSFEKSTELETSEPIEYEFGLGFVAAMDSKTADLIEGGAIVTDE